MIENDKHTPFNLSIYSFAIFPRPIPTTERGMVYEHLYIAYIYIQNRSDDVHVKILWCRWCKKMKSYSNFPRKNALNPTTKTLIHAHKSVRNLPNKWKWLKNIVIHTLNWIFEIGIGQTTKKNFSQKKTFAQNCDTHRTNAVEGMSTLKKSETAVPAVEESYKNEFHIVVDFACIFVARIKFQENDMSVL